MVKSEVPEVPTARTSEVVIAEEAAAVAVSV